MSRIPTPFHIHFTHFSYGTRAMARAAMSTPEVGVIMLVKPSPNWKASTIAWRDTPTRSENGAMMGMVMAALAVALGMRKLITA